jgi:prepilin-type N-terminal cleavage/methylation domain-containing protein
MKRELQKGFTLIELMTSLSIFMIIMVISMGSILGVFDANRKSQSESIVMNNLNLAIESMARDMRFGRNYHCGIGAYTAPQSCPSGDSLISFKNVDNDQMVYRLAPAGGSLERSSDGGASFTAVTAPEIVIENLTFYALGAEGSPANSIQPKVLISAKGYSQTKARSRTEFSLQTLVSQRCLDNGQCND